MKKKKRKFLGPTQFFHYLDHTRLAHCTGPANNPYTICHINRRHVIDKEYACGHGKKKVVTIFRFTEKAPGGMFFLSSGKIVNYAQYSEWIESNEI